MTITIAPSTDSTGHLPPMYSRGTMEERSDDAINIQISEDEASSHPLRFNQLECHAIIATARRAFDRQITKHIQFRKEQLKSLRRMLNENERLITEALKKDLKKPSFESILTEIDFVKNDIACMLMNVDSWSKSQPITKSIVTFFDDGYVLPEPFGVVLVIGAWNYPIQLSLSPLIGAITAGNCAILKPSELAPATAEVLRSLIPRYLDKDCYHVITGGPEETQLLLKEKFDYIFYTGGKQVGKLIYQAAAKNLVPVTLELGGKSPLYIDESVPNIETAARRILWGKYMNAGQTCVAPDYILCNSKMQEMFLNAARKILQEFYGDDPRISSDMARIVNEKHFYRLEKLLDSTNGNKIIGGKVNREERFIAPTIVSDVSPTDALMQEEIFGPILPIVVIKDVDEAISMINSREKPLSLYLFTTRSEIIRKFLEQTSSGSVCGNDTVIHLTVDSLPFGGVGESGIGAYHGKNSFDTFSHMKSVLIRSWNPLVEMLGSFRYPPYSSRNMAVLKQLLMKRQLVPGGLGYILAFLMGALAMLFCVLIAKLYF